jgi:antitoxin component of RelBE/YafQ-DinJ toxin-antitoxin module
VEGLTATDVLKAAMEQFINGDYHPQNGMSDTRHHDSVLTHNDVVEIVNTVVSTLSLPSSDNINTLVSMYVNTALMPINRFINELDARTQSQIEAMRNEVKHLTERFAVPTNNALEHISINHLPIDSLKHIQSINHLGTDEPVDKRLIDRTTTSHTVDRKSWGAFFEMVGIDAMEAKAAQKAENIPERDIQVGEGISRAKELGLGTWAVGKQGRDFVRID